MKKLFSMLLIFLLATGLCGCGGSFTENEYPAVSEKESVPGALSVFGGEDIGFSFLYPYGMNISWNEEDGACISETEGTVPYVLVCKTEKKGMTPEKYFKSCDKQLLKKFADVKSTAIHEVTLEGKTLYMTRYQCATNIIIERYVEIYPDSYFQYTAVSETAGEMNTALYYAASTLSPTAGKYVGEYSEKLVEYSHEDIGLSMELPEMLDIRELTIGYLATGTDALVLAVLCTADDEGNPIYNRQNFLDRAAANPDFVAGYLGTDTASFGSGEKRTVNGREFYVYPMTTFTGDEEFAGEILLANADENGCVVLCYGVKEGSAHFEGLSKLCQSSVNTAEY